MTPHPVSDNNHLPTHFAIFNQVQPGPGSWSPFVGLADRARIEHSSRANHFVPGDMGVTVEEKFRPARMRRRDMDEKKLPSQPFQDEMPGKIQSPIIVPQDAIDRRPHRSYRRNSGQITKIA